MKGLLLPPERIKLLGSNSYTNSDTLSANSGTQSFATTSVIPANTITLGVAVRVTIPIVLTSSAAPVTVSFQVKLGATVVYQSSLTIAPQVSLAARAWALGLLIAGTAAPGASVAVSVDQILGQFFPGSSLANATGGLNTTAQPVAAIATNGDLTLSVTYTTSSNTAGNSAQLRQIAMEVLGP